VIQRSKVVFRLDDVSDVWTTVNPALNKLVDTFVEAGVKLNAGIIGRSDLISSTGVVSSHLIKAMRQNNQAIEIFNHGPDSNAMTGHSAAVLKNKLDASNGAIEQVFGVSKPTSFVPHQNRWDEGLVSALVKDGMTVLSTQKSTGGSCGRSGNIMRAYAGASTQWNPSVGRSLLPTSETLKDMETQIGECGFTVVMIHPQEFATRAGGINSASFTALNQLLAAVKSDRNGMESAFFSELANA